MSSAPTAADRPLAAHPDRLFPAEASTRGVARRLHELVERLPILSVHGHVDVALLAEDRPFTDPATLLVSPDHYVTRLLHANGVPLDRLNAGPGTDAREVWRTFCQGWPAFAGTASGYWIAGELCHVLGLDEEPSAPRADAQFDAICATLATPMFRPRSLLERFGVEVLATTDDPLDDLAAHAALAVEPALRAGAAHLPAGPLPGRGVPGWAAAVERLVASRRDGLRRLSRRAAGPPRAFHRPRRGLGRPRGSRRRHASRWTAARPALFDRRRRGAP